MKEEIGKKPQTPKPRVLKPQTPKIQTPKPQDGNYIIDKTPKSSKRESTVPPRRSEDNTEETREGLYLIFPN